MADETTLFTQEFKTKDYYALTDYFSGTEKTTEDPVKIELQRLVGSICQRYNTYLFLGVAQPTTTPPLFQNTLSNIMAFYLTSQNGTYSNFPKPGKPATNVKVTNELVVIKSTWWKDPDDDSLKLRWEKEVLYSTDGIGGVDFNDVIKTEIEQLLSMGIGVINVEYIQPSPSEEEYSISYVKWENDKWTWYYRPALVSSDHIETGLEIGTKALLNGKYYILQATGAWVEDAAMDSGTLAELIAQDLIGVIKGRISNDIPIGNKGIFFNGDEWIWNIGSQFLPPGTMGSQSMPVPFGTKAFNTGISAIQGVEINKTYVLRENGNVEPDESDVYTGILHEFDNIVGNWVVFHDGDSLLLKSTNVFDIDAIHIQIKNLNIRKVDIYIDGASIPYSPDHLTGKVTGERLKDAGYMYHTIGVLNGTTTVNNFTYLP